MKPMLADSIDPKNAARYLNDGEWALEQKLDGHRALIHVHDGVVTPLDRRGEPKRNAVPKTILDNFRLSSGDWYFDGELIGSTFWLFDLIETEHLPPHTPFAVRRHGLEAVFGEWAPTPAVQVVPTKWRTEDKIAWYERLQDAHAEGVIFRNIEGAYDSGRRSAKLLKCKWTKDIDCVVVDKGRQGKDNIAVAVYDSGKLREIAEVTALAGDGPDIQIGDVVEVQYLYMSDGHRLVQCTRPRIRSDKSPEECTLDQAVYTNKEVLTWANPEEVPIAR